MDIRELFLNLESKDYEHNVNFHIHSNYSDGIESFDELVLQAKSLGMKYISITDHNTVEGYKNSIYKDEEFLIKGVEFDCFYRMSLLHILGYGIDIYNQDLNKLCAKNPQESKNDILRLFKSRHPKKVIDVIHSAGGVAVLAHPCCSSVFSLDHYVGCLVKLGIDGIETYYPYDRFRSIVKFSTRKLPYYLASRYDLFRTGGTDEHGSLLD